MSALFFYRYPPLLAARLVRRRQRFLADVKLRNGHLVVAHTNNTGSMIGCSSPGSRVYISRADDPRRRLRYTWETVTVGQTLVSVNTLLPNRLVAAAARAGAIPELCCYDELRPEAPWGRSSRVDLLLQRRRRQPCYVEIKNVTLRDGRRARFPDAVTLRGQKHLRDLMRTARAGQRAVLLFFVPRADCDSFAPADEIDPDYGELLRRAVGAGVEAIAYRARVRRDGVRLEMRIPVEL